MNQGTNANQQVQGGNANRETLNLEKGEMVNISKTNPGLSSFAFACGWDMQADQSKGSFDLDIFALLIGSTGKRVGPTLDDSVVYFRNRNLKGIQLSEDNLTGAGEGDDETMIINFNEVPADVTAINLYINIFNAQQKNQWFGSVRKAYIRCYDANDPQKLDKFRFELQENGGRNTGCWIGSLTRRGSEFIFEANGSFVNGSINDIVAPYTL